MLKKMNNGPRLLPPLTTSVAAPPSRTRICLPSPISAQSAHRTGLPSSPGAGVYSTVVTTQCDNRFSFCPLHQARCCHPGAMALQKSLTQRTAWCWHLYLAVSPQAPADDNRRALSLPFFLFTKVVFSSEAFRQQNL